MISAQKFYWTISSIVPLYVFMFIGYGSVKWWKIFSQEQCSGINRFCSLFAVPMLSFHYISKTNLYEMSLKLFIADVFQKVIVLAVLAYWYMLSAGGSIEWLITIFSICTLPNTLILGVRFIKSMYRNTAAPLVVEIFLAQSMIWHPLLLIMYEHRAAKIVIPQQSGDTHGRDLDIETAIGGQGVAGVIFSTNTRDEQVEAISVDDVGGGERNDLDIHVHQEGHEFSHDQASAGNEQGEIVEVPSTSATEVIPETEYQRVSNRPTSMPSAIVMSKYVMIAVWKKLIDNSNTCATFLGLVCAFILSKFHIAMPLILTRSVTFLSNASLGIGMFNMGLSLGLQPTLIPCGKVIAALTMVLRFIIGPIIMEFASVVVGLRGTLFRIAVVQAALSLGVAPSLFAIEYNVYPEIFSTGMIFGMVVAFPVTLVYYSLFEI